MEPFKIVFSTTLSNFLAYEEFYANKRWPYARNKYEVKNASLWENGKNYNELKTLTIPIRSVIKSCNGNQKGM